MHAEANSEPVSGTDRALVRRATAADAAEVAAIWNEGVAGRGATFETRPRTTAEVAQLITGTASRHAFLVAGETGQVAGWAATMPYSSRPVYDGVAEFSIYVSGSARGTGTGRLLLTALLDHAEAAGLHKVTSRVFVENAASRRLCAAHDFREAGVLLRHARLDGEWRDVVVVERLLGDALDP